MSFTLYLTKDLLNSCVAVLPPIETKSLTPNDVNDLSVRVREMMVKTLREISAPVSPSLYPADKIPAVPEPHPTPSPLETRQQPDAEQQSATPSTVDGSDLAPSSRAESRASTNWSEEPSSPALSRRGESENGVETEEDEGMVLVGRPNP